MELKILVSEHASIRIRERSGLNKKAVQKAAETAYLHGVKYEETNGSLLRYITGLINKTNGGTDIRIYGDKVYIFNKSKMNTENMPEVVLITVFHLPNDYKRHVIAIQARKQNAKK